MATGYVYLIKCPTTLNVVYIGVTEFPVNRFTSHCNGYEPVAIWAKSIRPLKPIMEIVHQDVYEFSMGYETALINEYIQNNCILFNRPIGAKYKWQSDLIYKDRTASKRTQ